MTIARKNLQSARLIHLAFLFASAIYIAIPFFLGPTNANSASLPIVLALAVVALSSLGAGFFLRKRMVLPAADVLCNNPDDAAAAARWRTGLVLSITFCETVLLFGFALKMLGASWNLCAVFYAVGVFFLLAWTPRLDLPAT